MAICTKAVPIGFPFALGGLEATLTSMLVGGQLETYNLGYSLSSLKTLFATLNAPSFGLPKSNHEYNSLAYK